LKGLGIYIRWSLVTSIFPTVDLNDHLGAGVFVGFKQDRVHPHIGLQAAGLGLNHLGPSHFTTLTGDKRIQGHILGFKGGHPISVLKQNPAQGRGQDAFSGIGTGPLERSRDFLWALSLVLPVSQGKPDRGVHFLRRPDGQPENRLSKPSKFSSGWLFLRQ
jgi:hypothetical protein